MDGVHHGVGASRILIVPAVHEVVDLLAQVVRLVDDAVRHVGEVHRDVVERDVADPAVAGVAHFVVYLDARTVEVDVSAREGGDRELVACGFALVDFEVQIADVGEDREGLGLHLGIPEPLVDQEAAFVRRDELVVRGGVRGFGSCALLVRLGFIARDVEGGRRRRGRGVFLLGEEAVVGAGDENQDGDHCVTRERGETEDPALAITFRF